MFSSDFIIIGLVILIAFVLAIGFIWIIRVAIITDPLHRRLSTFRKHRLNQNTSILERFWSFLNLNRFPLWRKLIGHIDPIKLQGKNESVKLQRFLLSSGYRQEDSLRIYLIFKYFLSIFFCMGSFFIFNTMGQFESWSITWKIGASGAGFFIGGVVAELILKKITSIRLEQIRKYLPDIIDMLIISLRAGLSFEESIKRITHEIRAFAPAISDEFSILSLEYRVMPDRIQALNNLKDRLDIDEVKVLVMTVNQSQKYGTSMADALSVMADESRKKRVAAAEAWGARLSVILIFPLTFFFMPAFMGILMGPAFQGLNSLFPE